MTWWNKLDGMRKGLCIVAAGLGVCIVIVACGGMQHPNGRKFVTTRRSDAKYQLITVEAGPESAARKFTSGNSSDRTKSVKRPVDHRKILTQEAVAVLQAKIKDASVTYKERLDARLALLRNHRRNSDWDGGRNQLRELLEDAVKEGGAELALRWAFSLGRKMEYVKAHGIAVEAWKFVYDHAIDTTMAAEALAQLGRCYSTCEEFSHAEQTWHRLVEECGELPHAKTAWLALAESQISQTHYDDALATLEVIADKFAETRTGREARLRICEVLAIAGKTTDALESYERFLLQEPKDFYHRIAVEKLAALKRDTTLVSVSDSAISN